MSTFFNIIVAVDSKMGIGKNNTIPWRLPSEMKYFQEITNGEGNNAVIMGRKTWESIPENRRPLKDRVNIVLSHDRNYKMLDGVLLFESLDSALQELCLLDSRFYGNDSVTSRDIFVIGGQSIYEEAIKNSNLKKIYLTEIAGDFNCDKFFPEIPNGFELVEKSDVAMENGVRYWKKVYERRD